MREGKDYILGTRETVVIPMHRPPEKWVPPFVLLMAIVLNMAILLLGTAVALVWALWHFVGMV